MKQKGLFDEDDRLRRLSEMGDPLEKIAANIDWEIFRPVLKKAFKKTNQKERHAGGRPPYDVVMMYKITLLQQWNNIGDDKTEYLINDRLSFQRFLGISLKDQVPDAKTIWLFKETLTAKGAGAKLNALFTEQLEREGMITPEGSIIDATFVDAPRQRNKREENERIKAGEIPESWRVDEEDHSPEAEKKRHKARQKDRDARWAKKNNEVHYGYKDHVKADKTSKLIVTHTVTAASVHDSQEAANLIDDRDKDGWLDSAYAGKSVVEAILKKNPHIRLHINEKGYRNKPLTGAQKETNREKSKVRVRVEHIFGHMTNSMGGITIGCIGKARAGFAITMKNLAYNISRYVYLKTRKLAAA
jgi:IS5 family transposase